MIQFIKSIFLTILIVIPIISTKEELLILISIGIFLVVVSLIIAILLTEKIRSSKNQQIKKIK